MQTILTVLHVLLSIGVIALVLLQHGKGADAGAAFGGGASATVFGSRGAGNFLSRTTAILATLFFLTSIALAYYATQAGKPESLMDRTRVDEARPETRMDEEEPPTEAEPDVPTPGDLPRPPEVPTPMGIEDSTNDVPALNDVFSPNVNDVPVPSGN